MFTAGQRAGVVAAFELVGYTGQLRTAPLDSGEERLFVVPAGHVATHAQLRALEQVLTAVLRVKVWVLSDADWHGVTVPFE
ncbi:hypothetical protein GCM10027446_27140 [Angustibacter peucedani]